MTKLDLDALSALAEAADPEKWVALEAYTHNEGNTAWGVFRADGGWVRNDKATAEFIAASREAVPALIARVRELEERCDGRRLVNEALEASMKLICSTIDDLVKAEREACAKLCEELAEAGRDYHGDGFGVPADNCASAIRERGKEGT